MKVCTACRAEKSLAEFSKDKNSKDGLRSKCKPCDCAATMARRDKAAHSARNKEWKAANQEWVKANREDYKRRNPDCDKLYYQANRESELAAAKQWRRENLARWAMTQAARRARVKQQTPAWANKDAIVAIYRQCEALRRQGLDVQVDHAVPLNGATVSGLHCEANLQILDAKANSAKRNTVWPEMPL
jgi:hypothetical protein